MKGLGKVYVDAKILEQREPFERFARAFNMSHPLCDFIDAGNGKECSDNKIRGMLPLTKCEISPYFETDACNHYRGF